MMETTGGLNVAPKSREEGVRGWPKFACVVLDTLDIFPTRIIALAVKLHTKVVSW